MPHWTPRVTYYTSTGWVHIQGPGGFTEFATSERQAEAIALALGVTYNKKG